MKTRYLIIALMVVIALLIILAYYSPEVPEVEKEKPKFVIVETTEPEATAEQKESIEEKTAEPSEVIIKVKNGFFDPDDLIIEKGTKVVWLNEDNEPHKIAERSAIRYFYGDRFLPGESYSFTFNEAGTYNYYDVIFYKTMRGKITVKENAMPITGKVISVPSYENKAVGALVLFAVIMLISVYLIFYYEKKH